MKGPRPYLALLSDGTAAKLVAVSRAAAILTAREFYGATLVRVVEDGDW
ncbi:MAG: hypothetical protein VKK97_10405 [Synechococcaceae cyanobacterium]|nr:hypothetical protein [Synechococcaceae cyanobacterium]